MRTVYTFIITLLVGSSIYSQSFPEPYDYDTVLKGGYSIKFTFNDSLQYLYLEKKGKMICELSSTAKGMLYKNLGYVVADFKDYFILAHSFGSGNPHQIELIKKLTGKNILPKGSFWIDCIPEKNILLYSQKGVPSPKDKMILYNISTGKKQFFTFPSSIFNEAEILNRIQIDTLTNKELFIIYETANGPKMQRYSR